MHKPGGYLPSSLGNRKARRRITQLRALGPRRGSSHPLCMPGLWVGRQASDSLEAGSAVLEHPLHCLGVTPGQRPGPRGQSQGCWSWQLSSTHSIPQQQLGLGHHKVSPKEASAQNMQDPADLCSWRRWGFLAFFSASVEILGD